MSEVPLYIKWDRAPHVGLSDVPEAVKVFHQIRSGWCIRWDVASALTCPLIFLVGVKWSRLQINKQAFPRITYRMLALATCRRRSKCSQGYIAHKNPPPP
jgi:hypothetical protein